MNTPIEITSVEGNSVIFHSEEHRQALYALGESAERNCLHPCRRGIDCTTRLLRLIALTVRWTRERQDAIAGCQLTSYPGYHELAIIPWEASEEADAHVLDLRRTIARHHLRVPCCITRIASPAHPTHPAHPGRPAHPHRVVRICPPSCTESPGAGSLCSPAAQTEPLAESRIVSFASSASSA